MSCPWCNWSEEGCAYCRGLSYGELPAEFLDSPYERNCTMLVNLTPHAITIRTSSHGDVTIPTSGKVARVTTVDTPSPGGYFMEPDKYGVIPVVTRELGIVDIPELKDGEFGIVSTMVLDAAKAQSHPMLHRLYVPDSGPTAIRDEKGQVKAVTRLVCA